MTSLRASWLFDGSALHAGRTVVIEHGRIASVSAIPQGNAQVLPEAAMLVPGFVDLQVNGGGGVMFNDALDPAGLRHIADAHAGCGTTTIVPTLISGSRAAIARAFDAVADAGEVEGIGGLHIEGPFIAASRRGIHPADAIAEMTDADLDLLARDVGVPVIATVAPESVGPHLIAALVERGVMVFAGHSDASHAEVARAMAAGVSGFTHLYNAMSPLAGRAPGMVGAALASEAAFAGIIADGHHVHPAAVRAAFAALGGKRLFLVSDAMATAGSDATGFSLYGRAITLRDGMLTDASGTLAGAHLTMAEAVRNAVRLAGIKLADALRMATATPAAALRLEDRGRIAPGQRADLVALDGDLEVLAVWRDGRLLHSRLESA